MSAYKKMKLIIRQLPCSREENYKMENSRKELNRNELGKVNGGIVVPINPNGLNPNGNNGIVVPIKPNGLNPNGSDGIVVPVNPDD